MSRPSHPSAPVDPLTSFEAARFGVYVHFPYCLSKCPYCDFASTVVRHPLPLGEGRGEGANSLPLTLEARYRDAILRELDRRLRRWPQLQGRDLHSIYFGGGTPSLWDPAHVGRVLEALRSRLPFAPGIEITLEANPGAADAERFGAYREAGINRLSMGVQSFHPETLKFLGRSHDGATAERAFASARAAGFDNVSLDFIYGVPGQTVAMARADAEHASSLGAEHLSAYALTLDRESLAEDVPLAKRLQRGEVSLPDDEVVVEMQRAVRDTYRARGLERYEISNYSKRGYHSRHNALYWTGGEYLALGTGATGFIRGAAEPNAAPSGVRYSNQRSAEKYLVAVETDGPVESNVEQLGRTELLHERIAMGLRLGTGIDLEATCREFGESAEERLRTADQFVARGLMRKEATRYVLTDEGADVHSAISARLM